MACNNCGKSARHQKIAVSGDVDTKATPAENLEPAVIRPGKQFAAPEGAAAEVVPQTRQEAFEAAKAFSFDDIIHKQSAEQKRHSADVESMYRQMTDAMRHFHVISLLSVANYENLAMPGVSPDQAVIALQEALNREDFSHINDLYPTLKEKVNARYGELVKKRISL